MTRLKLHALDTTGGCCHARSCHAMLWIDDEATPAGAAGGVPPSGKYRGAKCLAGK